MSGFSVVDAFQWLQSVFHVILAIGFAALCVTRAQRLGPGAWMLAGVAALDVVSVVLWRLFNLTLHAGALASSVEGVADLLTVVGMLVNLGSAALVAGAFLVMKTAPRPA